MATKRVSGFMINAERASSRAKQACLLSKAYPYRTQNMEFQRQQRLERTAIHYMKRRTDHQPNLHELKVPNLVLCSNSLSIY